MKRKFFSPGADDKGGGGDQKAEKPAAEVKETKQPLKPTLTSATAKHGKTEDTLVLRPGQVYIVPIQDGQEVAGGGFITNNAAAKKHYSDPKKYVIKKKAS